MDYFLREADPFFLGRTERGLLFEVCGNNFYSVRLTLIGADEDPPEDAFWEHADLRQNEEGGYIFCAYREEEPDAETQDEASPAHILFELPFREYETRVDYYDGTADAFGYAPWDRLTDCCRELAEKADCPFIMLNDREQELLPLIRELAALGDWEQSADKDFPLLKKLAATGKTAQSFGPWPIPTVSLPIETASEEAVGQGIPFGLRLKHSKNLRFECLLRQ